MKNIFILLFLLFQTIIFAQEAQKTDSDSIASNENILFTTVDSPANFPGGNNVFNKLLQTNFNSGVIKCETTGVQSTMIEFVVEKDGTLSNIKATGSNASINLEAIRTVKSIKTKWNPGIHKNENVRMRFKQPFKLMCN